MRILLTNDDGVHADGLMALYHRFTANHEVTIVAPERQRSAISHSITLHKPIRCERVPLKGGLFGYAVSGTPVDCVKLAVLELMSPRPDLVVSGINPGANTGFNVNYSGTVCAAKEAGFYAIPAIAVSMPGETTGHYEDAAAFIENLAVRMLANPPSPGIVINVNIPNIPMREMAGVKYAPLETSTFEERFEKRLDPRNRAYYWQGCENQRVFSRPDTDAAALSHNYITLTPIRCDTTDHDILVKMRNWRLEVHGFDKR